MVKEYFKEVVSNVFGLAYAASAGDAGKTAITRLKEAANDVFEGAQYDEKGKYLGSDNGMVCGASTVFSRPAASEAPGAKLGSDGQYYTTHERLSISLTAGEKRRREQAGWKNPDCP